MISIQLGTLWVGRWGPGHRLAADAGTAPRAVGIIPLWRRRLVKKPVIGGIPAFCPTACCHGQPDRDTATLELAAWLDPGAELPGWDILKGSPFGATLAARRRRTDPGSRW